jgi:hypothetical protein
MDTRMSGAESSKFTFSVLVEPISDPNLKLIRRAATLKQALGHG